MLKHLTLLPFLLTPVIALASTGAVDSNNCHKAPDTLRYHCHGSESESKQNHFLVGVIVPVDTWFYDDGPANVFAGFGAEVEYGAFDHFAVHGSLQFKGHMSGNNNYSLTGFDVGLKAGPNLVSPGTYFYGDVGYFSQAFNQLNDEKTTLAGIQAGVGVVTNKDQITFDARVLWRNSADVTEFWDDAGFPANITNIAVQFGLYYRM